MTRVRFIIKTLLLLFAAVNSTCTLYAQQSAQCGMLGNQIGADLMSSGGTALTSVKTGLEFNLSLTLPGQNGCNGTYSVNITTSNNITNGYTPQNYPYQFAATATNQYSNVTSLPSSGQGLGINIPFKFVPGTTCDGETGTFAISIDLTCADGSKHNCTLKLSLTAIAANYWTVEKHHVFGDLSGGALYWDVIIRNTNPTPGIGDLNIYSGSITDAVSSDAITSVTGNVNNLTGLNTATAKWSTGTIASTIPYVVYHVVTYSCKPVGTVVQNCVDYNFCLGKEVSLHAWNVDEGVAKANKPVDAKANKTPLVKTILPGGGTLQKPCCTGATGQACDTVTLTAKPNVSSNFAKTLTYGNNLNYSPGCEGEYQIVVTNNGNVPLNNIVVTDTFPSAQIDVTQITVTANSTSMNYNVGYNTTPYNTSGTPYPNFTQTWSGGYPTQFTLTTTSGTLLGGSIIIKVRFRIKATLTPGTVVNNCASLNYSGTYNGWANWCNVSLPPAGQSSSAQSCAPFTVQQPKAIPGIMKCIPNGQQTYSVGDIIHFRVVISNHGAANFSGNLADLLGLPQHLQYVPGSISYAQGEGAFSSYSTTPSCVNPSDLSNATGWQTPTLSAAAQNISGAITNMPGECALDKAYYLIIDFDAKVLPQSFGQYVNTATLTTAGGTLHSDAYYNIMRVAKIITTKAASTGFVEAGQPFNYIINVCDAGSVGLTNIKVKDILPDCVTAGPGGATATVHTAAGTITTTAVTGAAPNYSFGSLTIQPGDTVQLVIPVTRKSTDNSKSCCNALAKGTASPA
ncbi:MAG TPA: hypothetical protein VHB48_20560, partial [Chitinophagaceae bacterium]|nr:hypothetical protein [Chitinophagaceae bacterium]